MNRESFSPDGSQRAPGTIGFLQVVNESCDEPKNALQILLPLLERCRLTRQQLQAFRDTLPTHLDGVATQGLKCIAHTTLQEIENDLLRLGKAEINFAALLDALPVRMSPPAVEGLQQLADEYTFWISRNWAFPN